MHVVVTKGGFVGKTGIATPYAAYGSLNSRTFSVMVVLDDGSGRIELPIDAIEETSAKVERTLDRLNFIDDRIAAVSCNPNTAHKARDLKQIRQQCLTDLQNAKACAGMGFALGGRMWLVNQADAGYF